MSKAKTGQTKKSKEKNAIEEVTYEEAKEYVRKFESGCFIFDDEDSEDVELPNGNLDADVDPQYFYQMEYDSDKDDTILRNDGEGDNPGSNPTLSENTQESPDMYDSDEGAENLESLKAQYLASQKVAI